MSALTSALRARTAELSEAALRPVLRDPFWADRYPGRADRFVREDGAYHVSYLVQALEAGDPRVLAHYARWLRDLLVPRGMCTHHLAVHLHRLGEAVVASGIPGSEDAVRYLDEAERGLAYADGPAAELAAALPRIAARARAEEALALAGLAPDGDTGDLESLLAYLADAVAARRPELFARCCEHLGPFLARRARAPGGLADALQATARVLEAEPLPPATAAAAALVLQEALRALAEARAPAADTGGEGGVSSPGGPPPGSAEPHERP